MKFYLQKYRRDIPDQELIEDLQNVSQKIGRNTVTIDEYNIHGNFHATTLTRRFKSWFTCLELAGLEDSRSRLNITDEELFTNLASVWNSLGRQPKYEEMHKPLSKYSSGIYEDRFGTWYNALEKFIQYCND